MALAKRKKQQLRCVICTNGENSDIFTCIKCSQTFCMRHANEHKRILDHNCISEFRLCTRLNDIFGVFAGDVRVEENSQVVIHGLSVAHAPVRGEGEYSSGKHRLRFRIDSYNANKWIFFGIISHGATMKSNTWAIPSSYGWGGQDMTILNCAIHAGLNDYLCDFQVNDTIELILDCDHRIIYLTNQRTKCTHKINIDSVKCPFPWHFHLNLFYPNDQVRILCTETSAT